MSRAKRIRKQKIKQKKILMIDTKGFDLLKIFIKPINFCYEIKLKNRKRFIGIDKSQYKDMGFSLEYELIKSDKSDD